MLAKSIMQFLPELKTLSFLCIQHHFRYLLLF